MTVIIPKTNSVEPIVSITAIVVAVARTYTSGCSGSLNAGLAFLIAIRPKT